MTAVLNADNRVASWRYDGCFSRRRATMPDTRAAAGLVPLTYAYRPPVRSVAISTPGATTSGFLFGSNRATGGNPPVELPIEENGARTPVRSTAPTAITPVTEAGLSTSPSSLCPSLPAAATTTIPAAIARRTAAFDWLASPQIGGGRPPGESEITCAPLFVQKSIAAAASASAPLPGEG